MKLDQRLEQYIQGFFLPGCLSVGRPTIPVCPGLRVGPGNGPLSAKTRNIPGKLGRLGHSSSLPLCWPH